MMKPIFAGAIGAIAGVALTIQLAAPLTAQENDKKSAYEYLDLFGDVFERVRSSYVEKVNDRDLIENAIKGMLSSLDPHSSYMPPKSFENMQVQTRGEFGGLGLEVTMEKGYVKVVSPIDGTPAAIAGLQTGDLITHIDGEAMLGLSLSEAVEKMRGPVGSKITITVARKGMDKPFDVELTRATIEIKATRGRAEGDIGVLRITTFSEKADENLRDAIASVNAKIGADKVKGYVIDLRNNPGGLLNQAIAVADEFLDAGEIVSTRGRNPKESERHNAHPGDLAKGKPIVVLINGGSASASEILAGALQDHRRAIIVGEKSFGKGSVQTIMPLASKGAIRLTTARYYTPSGRSIQGLGIEPDILVEQAKISEIANLGKRRSEADLRGSLSNNLPDKERKQLEAEHKRHEDAAKLRDKDYQLAYALDLLRGLAVYNSSQNH